MVRIRRWMAGTYRDMPDRVHKLGADLLGCEGQNMEEPYVPNDQVGRHHAGGEA